MDRTFGGWLTSELVSTKRVPHVSLFGDMGSARRKEPSVPNADGSRVRKTSPQAGTFTEYVSFNGQSIAEKDQNSSWTDYIYANGAKIASVPTGDPHLHIAATALATGYYQWYDTGQLHGYVIQAKDKLAWRQFTGGERGGWNLHQHRARGRHGLGDSGSERQLRE